MDTMQVSKLRMRGHHLFCIYMAQNWTLWGPQVLENSKKYQRMLENPDQVIEIVSDCGDTCTLCLCNIDGMCELYDFREGGKRIDSEILNQLGLTVGEEITSGKLKHLIKEKFTVMPSICTWGCGVTDAGCVEGFKKLRNGGSRINDVSHCIKYTS